MPSKLDEKCVLNFSVVYTKASIPIREAVVATMESSKKSLKEGSGNAYDDAEKVHACLASACFLRKEILIFRDYLNMSLLRVTRHGRLAACSMTEE